jgi:hypothetical protein
VNVSVSVLINKEAASRTCRAAPRQDVHDIVYPLSDDSVSSTSRWFMSARECSAMCVITECHCSADALELTREHANWGYGEMHGRGREDRVMSVRTHVLCLDQSPIGRVKKPSEDGEIGDRHKRERKWRNGYLSRDYLCRLSPFWQGRATFRKERNEVTL